MSQTALRKTASFSDFPDGVVTIPDFLPFIRQMRLRGSSLRPLVPR